MAQDRIRLLVQENAGIIGFRERRGVSRLTTMSGSLLHEAGTPGLSYFFGPRSVTTVTLVWYAGRNFKSYNMWHT